MKKIGLICAVVLTGMSLAACSNQSTKEKLKQSEASSLAEESSDTLDKTSDEELFSDDDESTDATENASNANAETTENKSSTSSFSAPSVNTSSIQLSGGSSVNIQKPQLNNSTTDPTTHRVQVETAKIQHAWNVKKGIENPDGSETQNFKNWVAKRDQAWANGQSMAEYDQNQKY
ncbi:hypothetical protein HHK02_00285 [Limosilactobacillus reuteri]|uniref:Lipoprotein n=1 Tax=Limosilactobacillus reuteri TaxID=1598 RepID=A0A7L6BIY1_LIMRT|nr:hypothetical protein [Limosilactobacillus reuteri]QLQ61810.1 hypothetical protein HHK02_00285 [Limosilactobacillus reuteri]